MTDGTTTLTDAECIELVERLTGTYDADLHTDYYPAVERVIALAKMAPALAAERDTFKTSRDDWQESSSDLYAAVTDALVYLPTPDHVYKTHDIGDAYSTGNVDEAREILSAAAIAAVSEKGA